MVYTLNQFKVIAENEAVTSKETIINARALCTNIRDIVKANETAKEAYISNLSVLSANIGSIAQGAFGSNNNLWDLSTFIDDNGHKHYEGKMRVGGTQQYLFVDPILANNIPTGEYNITFKVGSFEISTESSKINGELVIQKDENSLDRTRITPTGTYYEHRNYHSHWVQCVTAFGMILSSMLFSLCWHYNELYSVQANRFLSTSPH